jgi:hypothetical protein
LNVLNSVEIYLSSVTDPITIQGLETKCKEFRNTLETQADEKVPPQDIFDDARKSPDNKDLDDSRSQDQHPKRFFSKIRSFYTIM